MLNLSLVIHILVFFIGSIGIIINREKKTYILLTVILTTLSMLRFDVGYDYFWYWIVGDKNLENNLIVKNLFTDLEFGIQKIYELTRSLGHPQYFFVITGLITFYFIYKGILKDSGSPIMSLMMFLKIPIGFNEANHLVMQYIALGIIFYYTKLIINKKYIQFITIVLFCAFMFHSSAILTLIFLFIPKKKINIGILILGSIFVYLNLKIVLPIVVSKILPQYSYLFFYGSDGKFSNIGNLKYQFLILILYIILNKLQNIKIFKSFFSKKDSTFLEKYYFNLFAIGIFLSLNLELIFPGDLSRRVNAYFIMYGFILFGNIFTMFNRYICKSLKLITLCILFLINIRGIIKFEGVFLNKKPYYNDKNIFVARPNSRGFKIFLGKKYEDMDPYLPNEIEFDRNN